MIDLLLVNAPSRQRVYGLLTEFAAIEPPVWAGLIARAALNAGFTVQILDAEAEGLTITETAFRVIAAAPRLAAFSIYGQQPSASTQCLPAASAICRAIKNEGINIPTLAFGTHPSALPERTLREEPFDYVVQGEGPSTIVEILRTAFGFEVPGLWRRRNGAWRSPDRLAPNIINLDAELPSQAWELLDMKRYRAHNWHLWTARNEPVYTWQPSHDWAHVGGRDISYVPQPIGGYASIQTSLGCNFSCSFCCIQAPFGNATPRMRYWSPQNVVDQIARLVDDYGITNIKIPDEMFTLSPARVKNICEEMWNRNLNNAHLNIWAYARIDTVRDEEMLALMREVGFRWLGLGIESGSAHVRDGVEKGRFGDEDIRKAVERVRTAGIAVGANYIFGLPDDTRKSMQETLDLACDLNTEWANWYCAMAYPGSPLHAQVSRDDPSVLPENNPCGWIGYSQHAPECCPLPTATLSAAEVLAFRDDAFIAYFSRPEYRAMIAEKFGFTAAQGVDRMLAAGKPKRDLLS